MEAMQAEELDKLNQEGDQHGIGSLMKTIQLINEEHQNLQFIINQDRNSNCTICAVYSYHVFSSKCRLWKKVKYDHNPYR